MQDAVKHHQAFLDGMTPSLLEGDVETCLTYLLVPHICITLNKTLVCTTRDDLRHALSAYYDVLCDQGVTELRRVSDAARFLSPTEIEGFHITSALRDGEELTPPYATRIVLQLHDGFWRASEQEGIVDNRDWRVLPDPRPGADELSRRTSP